MKGWELVKLILQMVVTSGLVLVWLMGMAKIVSWIILGIKTISTII